ncbi:DUF6355 family natural product biosynthesis protein [Acaricomes phytoseiuli]|uniref:DUF6355 family natural product biosynthesis protein n=1 Tax=Acaricomes phytoseiuli TaxID=291968 RepID=UPI0012EAAEE2|nr:DUF6355 family natural product biosynthesis protein [Acaricomes phytoseiuli]
MKWKVISSLALSVGLILSSAGAALAQSPDANKSKTPQVAAAGCGYLGNRMSGGPLDYGPRGVYNHCGSGTVMVQVDYVFGNERFCITPGIKIFPMAYANPITNIFYLGGCIPN